MGFVILDQHLITIESSQSKIAILKKKHFWTRKESPVKDLVLDWCKKMAIQIQLIDWTINNFYSLNY